MLEIERKLKQADMGFEVGDTLKLESDYQKLENQLTNLINKQKKYNDATKESDNFKGVLNDLNQMGQNTENNIKKIGRLTLAVFGIRGAWGAVRSAMGTLSQYDDKMANNIEYIRYALSSVLKPVIETLINLAYKLLTYINYIAKAWFGVNLFANASSKSFMKAQESTKKTAKNMKDMNKNVTSMDEITNLNIDNGNSDTEGISVPDVDLSKIDVPIPSWIQWIADNGANVAKIIGLIGSAIVGIKIANFLKDLGLLGEGFSSFRTLLLGLGIGLIIYGIYETIKSIVDFVNDPSWEKFADILKGLAIILSGVAIAMLAVNAANPVAWILLAIAVITTLVSLIIKNWDNIKSILGQAGQWFYSTIIVPISNFFKGMWDGIKNGAKNAWSGIKSVFSTVGSFFKNTFTNAWTAVKKVFSTGGKIFDGIKDGIVKSFKTIVNAIIGGINKVIKVPFDGINSALKKIKNINIAGAKPFKGLINTISVPQIPKLARGGIVNNPGPGVYMGKYIAGEKGPEAILPLSNSPFIEDFARKISDNMNNEIIINLLVDLNRNILELSKKPTTLNINGKELAQATYNDFKNEGNRLNASTSISIK